MNRTLQGVVDDDYLKNILNQLKNSNRTTKIKIGANTIIKERPSREEGIIFLYIILRYRLIYTLCLL